MQGHQDAPSLEVVLMDWAGWAGRAQEEESKETGLCGEASALGTGVQRVHWGQAHPHLDCE